MTLLSVRRLGERTRTFVLSVSLLALLLLPAVPVYAAVGDISTCQQLQNMTSGTSWQLVNDIDCSDTPNWNSGAGFAPINATVNLDGQGHTISGLYIHRPTTDNIGLFGATSGGSITNLRIKNASIVGASSVGMLGGEMDDTTITNVAASGKVQGQKNVGGLIGYVGSSGALSRIVIDGTVTGIDSVGGIVGTVNTASASSISDSINTAAVSTTTGGTNEAGGIAGYIAYSTLTNVMNVGPITTDLYVGGVVGFLTAGQIVNAVSLGTISHGSNQHGGLVGLLSTSTTLSNSYWSTGDTGESSAVGAGSGTVTGGGSVSSKTSYYNTSSQHPLDAWDFTSTWQTVSNSLPQLSGFKYLAISTTSLPSGRLSTAYSEKIAAADTHGPVVYTVSSGSLPAGLHLDSSSGLLSGTPTAIGTYHFTITAQDSLSSVSHTYGLVIAEPVTQALSTGIALPTVFSTADAFPAPADISAPQPAPADTPVTNHVVAAQAESRPGKATSAIWWWVVPIVAMLLIFATVRHQRSRPQ